MLHSIKKKVFLFIVSFSLIYLTGCKGWFGEKTDIGFIEVPKYDAGSVAYVPILPALTGLVEPVDVVTGFDELIYVADKGSQELIAYDQAGRRLQAMTIPGIKAVAQDRRLQILALGTKDTLIGDKTYQLDALYRIEPKQGGSYGLNNAKITKILVHPFYFRPSFSPTNDVQVRLNDVAVLADNSYYVTRSGPSNNPNQFGGPDNTVLVFNAKDEWQGVMLVQSSQGETSNFFRQPQAIVTTVQPAIFPVNTVSDKEDFYVSSLDPNTSLKVQAIRAQGSEDVGTIYSFATDLIVGDTSRADGFLYTANRFQAPYGLAYQPGSVNYLFVTDSQKDSLYVFSTNGLEGVRPPAGSSSTKFIKVSFGGTGSGPLQFRRPQGVTYADRIVYVCDSGNGRVVRFRLTTDFQ